MTQRTLTIIKPDSVENGNAGKMMPKPKVSKKTAR